MTAGVTGTASGAQINQNIDLGTMGEFRRSHLAGGAVPADQWVLVRRSTLTSYQTVVSKLEEESRRDRALIEQLLVERGIPMLDPAAEDSPALDAASIAVVNSLLSTVPDSSYFKDDPDED